MEPKPPKQQVITIENVLDGWISDYNNVRYPIEGSSTQFRYSLGMTTVRPGKKGHISPAEVFNGVTVTDGSSVINSIPRAICSNISGTPPIESWAITGGAAGVAPKVVGLNGMTSVGSTNETIAISGENFTTLPSPGTGYWGEDILYAAAVSSTSTVISNYIFYSFNTNANGYIGRFDGATSFTDDWIVDNSIGPYDGTTGSINTVKLTANVPHRMCVFDALVAIAITDGQYIDILDCSNDTGKANGVISMGNQTGTLIPSKTFLNIGSGWVATDICQYQNYLAISCVKTGANFNVGTAESRSRVLLWNGTDLDPTQIYQLDDWYVSSLFVTNGQLFAFTQGVNGTTKVKQLPPYPPYFDTIWEAPTSEVGNAPLPNQMEYFNGMLMWVSGSLGSTGGAANNVFGIIQTQNGWTLQTPYFASDGTSVTNGGGFLRNVNANVLYLGLLGSTTNKIIGVYGDGQSNGSIFNGTSSSSQYIEFRTPTIETPYRWSVIKLRAYFSSFDSSSSMLISLIPAFTPANASGDTISGIDLLAWMVSTASHPNIATTLVASTAELGGKLIPNISKFWLNIRNLNTSLIQTPPMLRKLEVILEETQLP